MVSDMYRILLVTLVVVALVEDGGATVVPAPEDLDEMKTADEWFCPPGNVMFMIEKVYWCFDTSPDCPNGALYMGECHCFPNTHRDRHGVCGKICSNCENGWCSSKFKCECNDGFTMSRGRCVPDPLSKQPCSSGLYAEPYAQSYAPLYPYGLRKAQPQQEPGFDLQSPSEFHSQSVPQSPKQLYSQIVSASRLPAPRQEVKPVRPQAPLQLPSGLPSASRSEFILDSSAEIHPESTPERDPDHSTALRPYPSDTDSDEPTQSSSQRDFQDQRCNPGYEFNLKTKSCLPKVRSYDWKIDLRADTFN